MTSSRRAALYQNGCFVSSEAPPPLSEYHWVTFLPLFRNRCCIKHDIDCRPALSIRNPLRFLHGLLITEIPRSAFLFYGWLLCGGDDDDDDAPKQPPDVQRWASSSYRHESSTCLTKIGSGCSLLRISIHLKYLEAIRVFLYALILPSIVFILNL